MSHRDFKVVARRLNADLLKEALQWLLSGVDWSPIAWRADCTWTPRLLAATALLWAWSGETTLVGRFAAARKIVVFLFRQQEEPAGTYQAFLKLLKRWTPLFRPLLLDALRSRIEQCLVDCRQVGEYLLYAVDGTRCDVPRTQANERVYAPARNRGGKKRRAQKRGAPKRRTPSRRAPKTGDRQAAVPQMWLTTLWHVGTGLPWDWRIGPSDSSERAHFREMLSSLPASALIAADAGFTGYEHLQAVLGSGRHILLRVGSNVRLLQGLGYVRESAGTVYVWPEQAARRGRPPLVLRLVESHGGKHPVYLLTDLPASRLSDRQVVEYYARRWGIELFYRHFKQTFQRRKLRSASPEAAEVELHWSLLGLAAMSLYALVQIRRDGIEPRRLSCAKVLQAFRAMLRDYRHPVERGATLCDCLRRALVDAYRRRNKTSRDYPRRKQEQAPGPPIILKAHRAQQRAAQSLRRTA